MTSIQTSVTDPTENEYMDFTYSITSYGADYPVDSLVQRIRNNKIRIPSFQRSYVWNVKQASSFIESLLLGLPVPGIFLSRDPDSADLLVIDGQQRLRSLQFFYDGYIYEKVFRLVDVQDRFNGKTYKELDSNDKQRLDDSIIHATIVKQDEPSNDDSSIYLIFKRLNSGGVLLQPQEIRTSIYQGKLVELLKILNNYPAWRNIYGTISNRLKDQEFILRFFAFYLYNDKYEKPLQRFLNIYMKNNRNLELHSQEQLSRLFETTITYINTALGKKAFRPVRTINASIYDSVMVGTARMLDSASKEPTQEKYIAAYNKLLENKEYLNVTSRATSDEPVVARRMELALRAFFEIL